MPKSPSGDITRLYEEIGFRIHKARVQRRMTQRELAECLGHTRTSVVNIESGRQRIPVDLLVMIAEWLDVPVATLLPDADYTR